MTARNDLYRDRMELERYDRERRTELLSGLRAEVVARWAVIRDRCGVLGHEFEDLPDNGINAPHFYTGVWPRRCIWCRSAQPDTTPEESAQ